MNETKTDSTFEVRAQQGRLVITHWSCGGDVRRETSIRISTSRDFWSLVCSQCERRWYIPTFGETETLWETVNDGEERIVKYQLSSLESSSTPLFVKVRRAAT